MRLLLEDTSLDRADRIQLLLSYGLQLVIAGQVVLSLAHGQWLTGVLAAGILLLTFVPALIRRRYDVYLPLEFDLVTILFIFGSLYLGEIRLYYARFWWWDLVLHTSAGFLMGLVGFLLVYLLNREQRWELSLSPAFVGIFAFTFAMTIGVVWELFEYTMDRFAGTNMQKSGLPDTMGDLFVNTVGALLVALAGTSYVRSGDLLLFDRFIRRFVERNRAQRSG